MKIGIFTDTYAPDINGVVSSIVTLQKGLEAAGHDVYIITSHKGFIHSTREGNVFRMPGLELKWLYGYILSTPYHFTVKAEIEKLDLDVVHVHTEFGVGIFGRIVAKSLNLPVVYTYHTMYEDYTHYINKFDLDSIEKVSKKVFTTFSRYICESVASIIAPSEKTKEKLQSYGVKRPIHIIPTGLDLNRFKEESVSLEKRNEIRKKHNIRDDEKLITYIGRIAEEKSIDIIVDGVPFIKNENCRLMIVGGGPQLDDLKKQAEKLGVEDRIIFTGPVPSEDVAAYYLISDCFVSASTSETQGMTFIESLASGLCVLARPDDVLEHLVIENETGFYFNTPEEFAQQAEKYLMLDEAVQKKIKENAREVVKPYEVDTFVNHVLDVYQLAVDEYKDSFIVKSIKSCNDYMKLYLDSQKTDTEETLMISLDDYMLYHIKKDDLMEHYIFNILKDRERLLIAYQQSIKKLRAKDRTRKEMYDFLINQDKVELNIKEINQLISTLEEKGYINDQAYMIMEINKLDTMLFGKKKILRKLVEKGIPYEEVEKYLVVIDDDRERVKAEKLASKYMMTIKNKSVMRKKSMIIDKLHADGFSYDLAKEIVNNQNYEDDLLRESVTLVKVVDKAIKNYIKKYRGNELRSRIISYALNKGFMYDDIVQVLEERNITNE